MKTRLHPGPIWPHNYCEKVAGLWLALLVVFVVFTCIAEYNSLAHRHDILAGMIALGIAVSLILSLRRT